eukprot:Nk52_evm33s352 gene=Nk52_evmTU33s352
MGCGTSKLLLKKSDLDESSSAGSEEDGGALSNIRGSIAHSLGNLIQQVASVAGPSDSQEHIGLSLKKIIRNSSRKESVRLEFDEKDALVRQDFVACLKILKLCGEQFSLFLCSEIERVDLPPEQVICKEGTCFDNIYFLLSGKVTAFSSDKKTIIEYRKGSCIGEESVLFGNPSSLSVKTLCSVCFMKISKASIAQAYSMFIDSPSIVNSQKIEFEAREIIHDHPIPIDFFDSLCRQYLRNFSLLQDISVNVIDCIIENSECRKISPGEVLLEIGQPVSELCVIIRGEVDVFGSDGEKMYNLIDGEGFGDSSLFFALESVVKIVCTKESELLCCAGVLEETLAEKWPHLLKNLQEDSVSRFRLYNTVNSFTPKRLLSAEAQDILQQEVNIFRELWSIVDHLPFCDAMPRELKGIVACLLKVDTYGAKVPLAFTGDVNKLIYIPAKGRIRMVSEEFIHDMSNYQTVGLQSCLGEAVVTADIVSQEEDSIVYSLDKQELIEASEKFPEFLAFCKDLTAKYKKNLSAGMGKVGYEFSADVACSILSRDFLFHGLDQSVINHISVLGELQIIPKGNTIYKQGDKMEKMYVLVTGACGVHSTGLAANGICRELVFGQSSLAYEIQSPADIKTEEDCVFLTVNLSALSSSSVTRKDRAVIESNAINLFDWYLLPESIMHFNSADLMLEFYGNSSRLRCIKSVPVFSDSSLDDIIPLALALCKESFLAEEKIVTPGSTSDTMYFVCKGEISGQIGPFGISFHEGTFFGDQYLMFSESDSAYLMTSEPTQICKISKEMLQVTLDQIPIVKTKFENEMHRRAKYLRKAKADSHYVGLLEIDVNRELMTNKGLFRHCEVTFLHQLASILTIDHVGQNEIFIEEGQSLSSIFFVQEGCVEIFVKESTGVGERVVVVDQLSDGDYLGEVEVLNGIPAIASVRATTECRIFRIEKKLIDYIFSKYPKAKYDAEVEAYQKYLNVVLKRKRAPSSPKVHETSDLRKESKNSPSAVEVPLLNPKRSKENLDSI